MQACARIGAIHSVVFGGFSAKSVQERIVDAGAKVVITADEPCRGGKEIAAEAGGRRGAGHGRLRVGGERRRLPAHRRQGRHGTPSATCGGTTLVAGLARRPASRHGSSAEHPLFILYTSGSTGKPKGVQHSTGGYLLQAPCYDEMDVRHQGPTTSSGARPTSAGSPATPTSPMARSPSARPRSCSRACRPIPDAGRFWKMIQRAQGHDLLHRADGDPLADQVRAPTCRGSTTCPACACSARSASRSIPKPGCGTTRRSVTSRCPIVDTWWQTETGGHMISPLPGATPLKPGSCTLPAAGHPGRHRRRDRPRRRAGQGRLPRHQAALAGDDPHHLGRSRALQDEPTFPRSCGGQLYLAGDGANRDADGYFWIMGRIDDVLNVSGHRLGTMEIESALVANPHWLPKPPWSAGRDDITGEAIVAFVVLKQPRPTGERGEEDRRASCATGSARRSARSPSPRTSASATTCPRRAPARSCAGCCARSPRARRSPRTCRRWRIRRSSSSCAR